MPYYFDEGQEVTDDAGKGELGYYEATPQHLNCTICVKKIALRFN